MKPLPVDLSKVIYFCEFHDEWVGKADHRYCEDRGVVTRWERVNHRPTHVTLTINPSRGLR